MEPTEKELEVRLRVLGARLASPPTDVDELLHLLDQTEIYLSRVKQSPSSSMSDALGPVMNSLITKEFLYHTKADVKVFVAACIHEIIRVTAPDAPYNDVLMKEIFAMIVDAFDKLNDMSGCSYSKRVTILEIMAKVRSCVVMLDLECDDLILHMFKYFLKSIRPDHPTNVFSSMEAIMTLILEESEDIPLELLVCLLSSVQKSTKGVIPVARRLAEKVISNCLMKLKPYFLVAVQSMGACLGDFGDIVASICKDSSITLEHNKADDHKLSERTVSDELAQESEKLDKPVSCLVEVGNLADTTIKVLSNGVRPLGNGHAVIEPISPELEPESSVPNEQCRNVLPIGDTNNLSSITEKPANEINFQYVEAKSSSVQLTNTIDNSRVDGDKETSTPTSQRDGLNGQAKSLKSDCVPVMVPETNVHLESEREAELQLLAGLVDANLCFDSAAPAYSSPGSGLPSHFSEMKSNSHKPASSACKETVAEITTMEKEGPTALVSEHEDQSLASLSDGKPLQGSKMSLAENAMTEVAAVGISDGQPLRKQHMEALSVVADANTFENQRVSNIKKPKAKDVTDRDASVEPCLKAKEAKSKFKKKERGQRKASRLPSMRLDNIGRKIEVWWPDDERFYSGVIDAFDPVTKKHRVKYDDGDAEMLFLRNERWNYIDSENFEKGQENDIACPESSSQMPKKQKTSSPKKTAARDRKSEESGDQNSTFKPRGSPRHAASELDPSLYDKTSESLVSEETKFDTDKNYSTKFKSNRRFKRENISTSGGTESVMRSTGGPEGDSFGRKSKIFDKDEGTESDSHKIKSPLDENFISWRKSALKFRVNFTRILNEEALKPPNSGDKGTMTESSETNNGLIANTEEELKLKQLSAHGVSNSIMSHMGATMEANNDQNNWVNFARGSPTKKRQRKAPMEANNDQNNSVKFARGSPTKKRQRKASRLYSMHLDNIGRKIEVWWPDDERFYTGVIDAFDPVTKKHRVKYDDGDAEILFLRNERWNYIDSKNFEKGQENEIACPESSSQMPKKRKASSRKRNAARERSKLYRKSEESGDQNSTLKPRGSHRHTTSELDPSLYDKTSESLVNEENKFGTDKNYSTNFKSYRRFKLKNISTSGGPESVMRSTGGPEGDYFGRKSKILDKDEGTESDSHKIKSPLDENSRSWRKSALKFRGNFNRILNEEALKPPNSVEKGTITESSETNNGLIVADTDEELKEKDTLNSINMVSDSEVRRKKRNRTVITTDTNESSETNNGLMVADTDEELKEKDTLNSINMVSDSEVRRKKRKRTVITTDTNDSDIKNLVDFSLKSAVRTNKSRRK